MLQDTHVAKLLVFCVKGKSPEKLLKILGSLTMGPNEELDLKDTEKQSHFNNNKGSGILKLWTDFLQYTLTRELIKLQTETNAETKIERHTILVDSR